MFDEKDIEGFVVQIKNPIFVALDVDDEQTALTLARQVQPFVGGFKVGPRLVYKYGATFVRKMAELGPVFVDNKYHDIPSTVLAALEATFQGGASFATVHASNGPETLRQIAEWEAKVNQQRPFQVLAVTVLTSFNDHNMPAQWRAQSPQAHVLDLARQVLESGLTGIVCSPEEIKAIRSNLPRALIVTPGIRLPTDEKGDQARTLGPAEAIQLGASALVVGRPIVAARDPQLAAKKFAEACTL